MSLKIYHVRLFILEKWDLEQLLGDVGFIPNLSHYCKNNLYFLCLWNPSCIRKSVPTYACFGPRMQAIAHVRGLKATLVILFPKIDFCSFKRLYLPFPHSLSQFDIWLGSKLALGFRIWASLENKGLSRKGYKMRCLQLWGSSPLYLVFNSTYFTTFTYNPVQWIIFISLFSFYGNIFPSYAI